MFFLSANACSWFLGCTFWSSAAWRKRPRSPITGNTEILYCCFSTTFPPIYCITLIIYTLEIYSMWLQHNLKNGFVRLWLIVQWSQASVVIWVCLSDSQQRCFTSVLPKYWTSQNGEKKNEVIFRGNPIFFSSVIAAPDFIRKCSVSAETSVRNVLLPFMLHF